MNRTVFILSVICSFGALAAADVAVRNYNSSAPPMPDKFIELLAVVDNSMWEYMGKDEALIRNHVQDVVNYASAIYAPIGLLIVLADVIIWKDGDPIDVNYDGNTALTNFREYHDSTLQKKYHFDAATLMVEFMFKYSSGRGVWGWKEGNFCNGNAVSTITHGLIIDRCGKRLAHELGHNMGFVNKFTDGPHIGKECCEWEERCLMQGMGWRLGHCEREHYENYFSKDIDAHCFRDIPKKVYGNGNCGNGIVEPGEDCDCGLWWGRCGLDPWNKYDPHHCCDVATCKHLEGKTCSEDEKLIFP